MESIITYDMDEMKLARGGYSDGFEEHADMILKFNKIKFQNF
jgi:hypothetical protein